MNLVSTAVEVRTAVMLAAITVLNKSAFSCGLLPCHFSLFNSLVIAQECHVVVLQLLVVPSGRPGAQAIRRNQEKHLFSCFLKLLIDCQNNFFIFVVISTLLCNT